MKSLRPDTDDLSTDVELLTAAALSLAALGVAAAFVPLRSELDNANVAVILMGLLVLAGVVAGRRAALCVAAVGALSFNFFHTEPYGTLKMSNGSDVVLTVLFVASGLAVGEIAAQRARRAAESAQRAFDLEALERLTVIAADQPLTATWDRVRHEIERVLSVREMWFELENDVTPDAALPRLDTTGVHGSRVHRWTGEGFALPAEGVQLPVASTEAAGRIVLRVAGRSAVSRSACNFAVAVAGLLALAIDRRPSEVTGLLNR